MSIIDNTLAAQVPTFDPATPLVQANQIQAQQEQIRAAEFKQRQTEIGSEARGLQPFVNTPEFPAKWAETADRMHQRGLLDDRSYQQWRNTPSPLLLKQMIAQTEDPRLSFDKQEAQRAQGNSDRQFGLLQNADKRAAAAAERAAQTPLEAAQERAAAGEALGLEPGTPEYNAVAINGKLPETTTASRPMTPDERKAYNVAPDAAVAMTPTGPKAIGGPQTAITTNVDLNSNQTYDKQLAEGLGKSHAALANGVEDAQTRARDVAAMQAAVDSIQQRGGTTGGMGQQQILDLTKTINAGATALGIEKPFNESDLSDKEFLTKFNRSMAGAQAKNAVGSRVTNFEMSNYLKANPGLDMSPTGNQRLLGIQAQMEQRNIAVGNAIRDATAEAISQGKKIDPVTVQKIITDYDTKHHIHDVVSGQDLTQSVAIPEFQGGANTTAAGVHQGNITKIRKFNAATGRIE